MAAKTDLRGIVKRHQWRITVVFVALATVFALITEVRPLGYLLVGIAFIATYLALRVMWLGPATASMLALSVISAIYIGSKFKFWLTSRRLHPHDLYLYLNLDNVVYAQTLYPTYILSVIICIAVFAIVIVSVALFEGPTQPTRAVFIGIIFVTLTSIGVVHAGKYMELGALGAGNGFMHFDHQHVSTFALSTIYTWPEMWKDDVFDYGNPIVLNPKSVEDAKRFACSPTESMPDIFLIMRESAMVPSLFPEMRFPNLGPEVFASSNGESYKLRVETHGAGSAYSIYSALTGLSPTSFGSMMNLAIDLSIDKIKISLPQMLEQCGYRTLAFTTGMPGYVLDRPFYSTIGFDEYHDLLDIVEFIQSDSDKAVYGYVSKVLSDIDRSKPLFVYIDTTAAHGPYDSMYRPDVDIPEADSGVAEVDEYIRRLIMGERDLDSFFKFITHNRGRALVADFGDHQPSFTKYLPGRSGTADYDQYRDDPLLFTFFRLRSVGFTLPELPTHPLVDVAFLGDWVVRAADLSIDGIYRQRWSFLEMCSSRYWQCDHGDRAHQLHQTLRAADLISIK